MYIFNSMHQKWFAWQKMFMLFVSLTSFGLTMKRRGKIPFSQKINSLSNYQLTQKPVILPVLSYFFPRHLLFMPISLFFKVCFPVHCLSCYLLWCFTLCNATRKKRDILKYPSKGKFHLTFIAGESGVGRGSGLIFG